MKNITKFLTLSLVTSAFLCTGCGGEVSNQQEGVNAIKPHRITRTVESDTLPINYEDFTAKLDIDIVKNGNYYQFDLYTIYDDIITNDIKHMQIYIDIDNDADTGLNIGEDLYAIVGADYMIEDDKLYISTSNSEWTWEYVKDVSTSEHYGKFGLYYGVDIQSDKASKDSIRISIEPVDENWTDTNNYIPVTEINFTPRDEGVVDYEGIVRKDGKYKAFTNKGGSRKHLYLLDLTNNTTAEITSGWGRYTSFYNLKFVGDNHVVYKDGGRLSSGNKVVDIDKLEFFND